EVVACSDRKEVLCIREVPMECLRDALSDRMFLGREEARQDSQQVTEQFSADEVVVNKTVVLLAGIRRVGADGRAQDLKTCFLPCLAVDPHVEVAVHDSAGPKVPVYLQQQVLGMGFQKNAPFA